MTTPLTRPLFDNRLLRATGGPDLALTTRQGMGAAFQMPTLGDLTGRDVVTRPETFTEDQQLALREAERDRVIRLRGLEDQLRFSASDQERDALTIGIERLSQERKDQLQAATRENIEAGRVQPPEVLNEQYKDLGVTFDYAMSSEQAERIAAARRAQMIQEAIMSRSPSGLIPSVAYFGAGLAAMATDPLELATMFIPIVGPAGRAWAVGRLGRIGGRIAVGAVEGAAGQALVEPLMFGLSRQAQLDYTMTDSLLNVGLGLAFGGAVGGVAGAFARRDVAAPIADVTPPVSRVEAEAAPVSVRGDAEPVAAKPDDLMARAASEPPFGGPTKAQAEIAIRQFANDQSVAPIVPPAPRALVGVSDVRGFRTAQGSVYEYFEDGTTVRTKAERLTPGHEGDFGLKPRTSRTVFVDENAAALSAAGLSNIKKGEARVTIKDGKATLAIWNPVTKKWGASPSSKNVPVYDSPKEGRYPLELWGMETDQRTNVTYYTNQHAGNKITEILDITGLDSFKTRGGLADASTLAENAMRDPLADVEASRAIDAVQDVAIEDEIAEYEAMLKDRAEFYPEAAADMDAAKAVDVEINDKVSALDETVRAAIACLVRS